MNQPARRTVLQELDESDGMQGLTSKQYQFAIASFSGLSDCDAYRKTYDCSGMNDASIQAKAREVAHHPLVTSKLRELRVKVDAQTTLAPYLSRELVLNGIMGLAATSQKDSVRLAAYIALGKTVGIDLFRDVHVTEHRTRTPEDVDRELLDHINKLNPVLEGKANVVAAPASEGAKVRDRRRKPAG